MIPRGFVIFETSIVRMVDLKNIDMNDIRDYEESQKKYGQECLDELKERGFNTESITPEQAVIILEPSHAPENFYCDGEVSHAQGLANWKSKMKRTGMTPLQISKAQKFIFG